MPATGELIRMMNYVDDITATLRRVIANVPYMTEEEKKDRKSTRLNSSHSDRSRMPSSA